MSENNNTTAPASPAATPPAAPITAEHISALHRHIEQVKDFVVTEVRKAVAFVRKEAPLVEAGAAAIASAVPVVGPIAAVIGKAAGEAAAIAGACCGCGAPHGPNGCTASGCSCGATSK